MATDLNTIAQVLQKVRNDAVKQDHFFRTLATAKDPFPWLAPVAAEGYLDPSRNPQPEPAEGQPGFFTVPGWNVLRFLENVAAQNASAPDESISLQLCEWVNQVIAYRTLKGERVDNYHTDASVVKILLLLPINLLGSHHFDFIAEVLRSTKWGARLLDRELFDIGFPRLIKARNVAYLCRLLDIVLDYRKNEGPLSREYESIIGDHELMHVHQFTNPLVDVCGAPAARLVLSKMNQIVTEDPEQFNNIWIPAIEEHPRNKFLDRYEFQLTRLLRDFLARLSTPGATDLLEGLLREEHAIFKRIAVHTVDHRYDEFSDLIWPHIGELFGNSALKHELYEFFRNRCGLFTDRQILQLIELIEAITLPRVKEKGRQKQSDRWVAYARKEWLNALLPTNREDVSNLYAKYDRINPVPIDHPGMTHWTEEWHGDISPIDATSLSQMSNGQIAQYLNTFLESGRWKTPTMDGLSGTLRECVRNSPLKFCSDLESFVAVNSTFQYALLAGLREAWKANGDVVWGAVIEYVRKVIADKSFWIRDIDKERFDTRNWVVAEIADLFEQGASDKERVIEKKILAEFVAVQIDCLARQPSELSTRSDLITAVINSVRGKLFRSLIVCSLAWARHVEKQADRWLPVVRDDFTKRLNPESGETLEFPVVISSHLPNLLYLDQNWVWSNFEKIFNKENLAWWKASINGYFFYSSVLYEAIYKRMMDGSHLNKVFATDFEDKHVVERAVQQICVSYLNGYEQLDSSNSKIRWLLDVGNPEHLRTLIQFFWGLRDGLKEQQRERIVPLWGALHERLTHGAPSNESKGLLSDLSKWLGLLATIDDTTQAWIESCSRHVEINFNSAFFVEYLLRHAKKAPERVARIYSVMLQSGQFPDYDSKDIAKTVEELYAAGLKKEAIAICNAYLQHGLEFLVPTMKKLRDTPGSLRHD
jgi:hypothetical protein